MYGFSIQNFRSERAAESSTTYQNEGYVSRPYEFQSDRSIFDIEQPKLETSHRWLDDYGWL